VLTTTAGGAGSSADHPPDSAPELTIPAIIVARGVGTSLSIGIAVAVVAAATHCRMDRYGGGVELRPWEGTSERASYDHVAGRWLPPKRWVRYDGAPEDVGLTLLVGVPLVAVVRPTFRWIGVAALVVAGGYDLLRRRLASLAPVIAGYVPEPIGDYVPERYQRRKSFTSTKLIIRFV